AEPAPVGAHARLPRPFPHEEPPVLHHVHRTPGHPAGVAAAYRPRRAQPRHPRRQRHPTRSRRRHRDQRLVARPLRPPRRRRTRTRRSHRRTPPHPTPQQHPRTREVSMTTTTTDERLPALLTV